MEFEVSSIFILFSCFVLVFILSKNNKPKLNLPPGPRKFPFIGNLHLLAGSDLHHHTLRDLAEKYGPLMHLKLGEVDNVIVSSPEIAKEFLKTHDLVFASRPSLLVTEIGCYGSTDVAFAPYGEYWRQMRRIFMLELLNAKRVQLFRPIREEEVLDLCKLIALHAGSTINLTQKLIMTNLDIMVRAALGKKTDDQATLIALIREGAKLNPVSNIVDVYPSIKFLSLLSRRKLEKYRRQLDMISDNIIEQHKQAGATKSNDEAKHNDHDLLDVLLKLQGDGSLEIPLTTDNIKAVLVDLFGAGVESLSSTVDWAMAEMLKNPRVLKWAQDEVSNVFDGKNHVVDECYFDELNYLKFVIKETLRLHPPAPLLLPRESRERCEINGYEIPAKTRVLVNAWAMGRDPKYWGDDAESFEPERFFDKLVDFKANSLEYIPFGAGRRICPGVTFAPANVMLQLAMFLYHFDWSLPNGMKPEEVDMTEFFGMTTRRKNSLSVIPIVRRPLQGQV